MYFYHFSKNMETKAVTLTPLDSGILIHLHEYFVHGIHICDDFPVDIKVRLSYLEDVIPVINNALKVDNFDELHWHISAHFPLERARSEAETLRKYLLQLLGTYPKGSVFIYTVDDGAYEDE